MRCWSFALLCAVGLAMSFPSPAQPSCTQEMIRGTWVDSIQGFMMMNVPGIPQPVPVPGVTLAIFKIDWLGEFTATGTINVGGQIATGDVAGTFQVNPDCTATATFTIQLPGMPRLPGVESLVIVDHGNEMWSIPVQEPLGKGATLERLRRVFIAEPQCSNSTVVGRYGIAYQGHVVLSAPGQTQPAPVPASMVGAVAIDYQGNMTGGATGSRGGTIVEVTFPNSAVHINSDCTGTLNWGLAPKGSNQPLPGQGIDRFVALNNGDEILLMTVQSVQGSPVTLGTMKRISRVFWGND